MLDDYSLNFYIFVQSRSHYGCLRNRRNEIHDIAHLEINGTKCGCSLLIGMPGHFLRPQ